MSDKLQFVARPRQAKACRTSNCDHYFASVKIRQLQTRSCKLMSSTATAQTQNSISQNAPRAFVLIAACFTLSGAAGLIYEVLWMRMLGLVFGATTVAISVVLSAFMGGLALGSALGGRLAARFRNALRAYGIIEIGIGLTALCLPLIFRVSEMLDAAF